MVVVKLKDLKEILNLVSDFKEISVFGCEIGSGKCRQGGLQEAERLSSFLKQMGKTIVEVKSLGGTCIVEKVKRVNFKETEAIISLACGAGTQVIAEQVNIPVITGVDTLFIGADSNSEIFKEYCIACGDCIISRTGGICPVARCPKSLINGPCGGATDGKCEVDENIPCVWYEILERMERIGTLQELELNSSFRDYRISVHPRRMRNDLQG